MTTPDPTLTDEMLGELRALEAKATPGPWKEDANCDFVGSFATMQRVCAVPSPSEFYPPDMIFIAAARNALPALISAASRTLAAEAALRRARRYVEDAGREPTMPGSAARVFLAEIDRALEPK